MAEMRVLKTHDDPEGGDSKSTWDINNVDEVAAAKKTFKDLIAKGYKAFKVAAKGKKGEQIKEFPKMDGQMILVPPVMGG